MTKRINLISLVFACCVCLSCKDEKVDPLYCPDCPTVASVSPDSGFAGDIVKIAGTHLKNVKNVYFGQKTATDVTVLSDSEIQVRVPDPEAAKVTVSVEVANPNNPAATLHSNIKGSFSYKGALLKSFSPLAGGFGTTVTITGEFGNEAVSSVQFNNIPATFTKVNNTTITAVVPKKAGKGKITIRLAASGQQLSTTQLFDYQLTYTVSLFVSSDQLQVYARTKETVNFIQDVAFYNGKLYATNYLGGLFIIDMNGTITGMIDIKNSAGQLNSYEAITIGNDGGLYFGGLNQIRYIDARGNWGSVALPNERISEMAFFEGKLYATTRGKAITFDPATKRIASIISTTAPLGVCSGTLGLFFTDLHAIYKISYSETVFGLGFQYSSALHAGNINISGSIDGAGFEARFNKPASMVMDSKGKIYVADTYNHQIRMIDENRNVKTIAGSGISGTLNGVGKNAQFNSPFGIEIVNDNTLYVVGEEHHIQKISIE